jgi:hypothetical protein
VSLQLFGPCRIVWVSYWFGNFFGAHTNLELGESSNGLCDLLLAQVLLEEFLQEHLNPGVGVLRRELAGLGVHRHAEAQHTERVPEKWKILLQACNGVRHKERYIHTVPYHSVNH